MLSGDRIWFSRGRLLFAPSVWMWWRNKKQNQLGPCDSVLMTSEWHKNSPKLDFSRHAFRGLLNPASTVRDSPLSHDDDIPGLRMVTYLSFQWVGGLSPIKRKWSCPCWVVPLEAVLYKVLHVLYNTPAGIMSQWVESVANWRPLPRDSWLSLLAAELAKVVWLKSVMTVNQARANGVSLQKH